MKLNQSIPHNKFIHQIGENYVVRHLKKLGHTILRRNYRDRSGKISIISFDKHKTLCFYEITTAINKASERELSNTPSMLRCVQKYISSFPVDNPYWEAYSVVVGLSKDLSFLSLKSTPYANIEIS